MDKLAELMKVLRQSRDLLFDEAETATRQKLYLHRLQKEELETILVQLISCKEFVEKSLETQSQCLTQTAKMKVVQHIDEAHSKVSELQPPSQIPGTAFVQNRSALSAYTFLEVGNIESTLSYRSVPGLFSVDSLQHAVARKVTTVSLITSVPSLSAKLLYIAA